MRTINERGLGQSMPIRQHFGEEPSSFATLCFTTMKSNNVKKVLEIRAGHGRDTMFFASNGLEVDAIDFFYLKHQIKT